MKKSFKSAALLTISISILSSCGNSSETAESTTDTAAPIEVAPIEDVVYEPFSIEKMKGNWKATDALGYSKDKIIGKLYSFGDSSATFYASYGDGGMENAVFTIENDEVILSVSKEDPTYGGTSTMTTKYTGGFNGDKLVLKSQSEEITLTKQ
jgi:hypothetical protein